jgi:Mg2+ and Co2+ transporter CorA
MGALDSNSDNDVNNINDAPAGERPAELPSSPRSLRSADPRVAFAPVIRMDSRSSCSSSSSSSAGGGGGGVFGRPRSHSHRSDRSWDPEPIRRRMTRAPTLYTIDTLDPGGGDSDASLPAWEPGSEPAAGADAQGEKKVWCHFTVVEFSHDDVMVEQKFDNVSFCDYLARPQAEWVKCRWISVTGISRDVVDALQERYALHELAVEDLFEGTKGYSRNLTKADWYPTHAFITLTLQYVRHKAHDEDDDPLDGSHHHHAHPRHKSPGLLSRLGRWCRPGGGGAAAAAGSDDDEEKTPEVVPAPAVVIPAGYSPPREPQTMQQYHSWHNYARSRYLESVSALLPQRLEVMAERVSLFLTNDNTIISFFESVLSQWVEEPVVRRISTRGTVLRESCDASLVMQAIIDTVVDMALPLTQGYAQAIEDLELEVLSKAEIEQTEQLYICISEINKLLTYINPIDNMVNVIRDHKTDLSQAAALERLQDPSSGVIITPMTNTYLGDVLDHCIIVTEALNQLKQSAENLINLIFNKTAAEQNGIMQALTYVTIFFLPLTFITGFFGQNFTHFPETEYGISFFWKVSIPTAAATIVMMLWPRITASVRSAMQRRTLADDRIKIKRNRQLLREARTQTVMASRGGGSWGVHRRR